jgi:hypothetical protein
MEVRSTVGLLALGVAAAVGIGIVVSPQDSPWCDDIGGACPAEVLYNDLIYIVTCFDHIVGFEQARLQIPAGLRGEQLRVRFHSGDVETERRAWTVTGIDPAELIVLDETDTAYCAQTEFAYAFESLSGSRAAAMLHRLTEGE